jgi:hypothetical protein
MIDAGRQAGCEEVFVGDTDMIQCTAEEWAILRSIRMQPGVSISQEFFPSGHRIVRHFPVPSITTL